MKDITKKPLEGFFTLQIFDKEDNLVDEVSQQNLIMERSKTSMANQIAGKFTANPINGSIGSFTLGTKGHVGNNILSPREFEFNKTELFSQDEDKGDYWMVDFRAGVSDTAIVNDAGYFFNDSTPDTSGEAPTVLVQSSNSEITYTYTLGLDVGNGGGAAVYTEASMCTNLNKDFSAGISGDIFSMRTFAGKIKDDSVRFVITWKLVF